MKEKKIRLKKPWRIIFIVVLIIGIFGIYNANYPILKPHESKQKIKIESKEKMYNKKFKKLGYNDEEIKLFLTSDEKTIEYIINSEKNDDYYNFLSQKYFLSQNLNNYLNFKQNNPDKSYNDIIAIINTQADKDYYSETIATDISKNNLMLVNKFNALSNSYIPELVQISSLYTYDENFVTQETYDAYINMYNAAKENNIDLLITSSYRSYTEQKNVYENYNNYYGKEKADELAAMPGYSEHQTGLALDIFTPGSTMNNFHNTEAYKWLINNCYKFGFILRYPSGKEYLTGFSNESWHYRYVGVEVATKIYNENITFDEYYAYYFSR